MLHCPVNLLLRDDGNGRVCAHSTRIRAFVAIIRALMVLRDDERHHLLPIHQREQRKFGTLQELLHHHLALAEMVV